MSTRKIPPTDPNTVHCIKTAGELRTGICTAGPLRGQRVASLGGAVWIGAGNATAREFDLALSQGLGGDWLDNLFGFNTSEAAA
ncbi:MAG TPA: hypothetical protein VEA40_00525 [Ramlibacter sp.]|nr:hypothetical protein [Ramlibacter sp.]